MTTRRDPFEVKFTDVSGPTHWPSLLPDDARQAWADLRDWVEALVDRFGGRAVLTVAGLGTAISMPPGPGN